MAAEEKKEEGQLRWSGMLRRPQLDRLKLEVPDFIICPAYTRRFGCADEAGLLYVPGALAGFTEAKTVLKNWYAKKDNSELQWWPKMLKEKAMKPITAHAILDGVLFSRWEEYVALFRRTSATQRNKRYAAKKKAQIVKEKEEDYGVAAGLLGLSSNSNTSLTGGLGPRSLVKSSRTGLAGSSGSASAFGSTSSAGQSGVVYSPASDNKA